MKTFAQQVHRFSVSDLSMLLIFLFAYACAVLEMAAVGICLLSLLVTLYCLCHDDIVPMILPLLLMYGLSFLCPASVWLAWLGIPCGGALVFCMVKNLRGIRLGRTFPALVATSLAVLLGGLGSITAEEYFAPGALFNVLGLSLIVVAFYLFLRGSLTRPRDYDVADYVSRSMYVCALFIAFLLLRVFLMHPEELANLDKLIERMEYYMGWRNGASILLILCLPFIFYYARKHGPLHLLSALFVCLMGVLSGSRAFIVGGAMIMVLGILYYAYRRPLLRGVICSLLVASAVLLFCYRGPVLAFVDRVLCFHYSADYHNEVRYKLFVRAFEDLRHTPIFGRGLGYIGNDDLYPLLDVTAEAARWRVHWYHSLIPQVVGSFGTVGILAYGYLLVLRLREFFTVRRTAFAGMLMIAYFAALAYSMFDPGIFSPFPFAILHVMVATLIEVQPRREKSVRK